MNLESPITTPLPIYDAAELLKDAEDLLEYGTWIWVPNTGTMEWSHGMCRLLGYSSFLSEEKNSLNHHLTHLPEHERETFCETIDAALQSGSAFRLVHSLIHKEGHQLLVVTKGKVCGSENGRTHIVGTTQNIAGQLKQQEERLQHKKLMDQYELFLKFGTWEFIVATQKLLWSAGMYNLFGYDAAKDKDLKIDESLYAKHINPLDYKKGQALRDECVQGKRKEYFWQYRITTGTGEQKWLETYGHVIRDEKGNYVKTFGLTRDITRLKLYEHGLELKIRELNRSNSELEEFAYVASHDMQEPLRKLITFSERLKSRFADILEDEGQLYINRMTAATNNMRLLIDNLLDFSRIARTDAAFVSTDLNEALQQALADLEVAIDETKAEIIAGPLPVIEAQPPQMKQLFSNIVSNAIKFRKPSTPPHINIRCNVVSARQAEDLKLDQDNQYFSIEFKDNGIGFEQEYAQKIFQIFQRLHGKAEYPGSGIGLAICKKIVDYHNGCIYAQGQISEGAVITVILPKKQ